MSGLGCNVCTYVCLLFRFHTSLYFLIFFYTTTECRVILSMPLPLDGWFSSRQLDYRQFLWNLSWMKLVFHIIFTLYYIITIYAEMHAYFRVLCLILKLNLWYILYLFIRIPLVWYVLCLVIKKENFKHYNYPVTVPKRIFSKK